MLKLRIIIYYIYYCIKIWAKPWRFSQFNAEFFNDSKWIFSKYEIEENIPEKFKLKSIFLLSSDSISTQKQNIISNFKFPIFLKPEWGQNSHWIIFVEDKWDLDKYLKQIKRNRISYLCQESSILKNEYEILYTKDIISNEINIHCITKTINIYENDYPLNWIYKDSSYVSIINQFSISDINKLKKYILEIWNFNVWRIGLKANSISDLLLWNFKIFEINIFLPMMLSIFDSNLTKDEKTTSIKNYIKSLVKITKYSQEKYDKPIFFRKIWRHYTIKFKHNKYLMKIKKIIYSRIENKFMHWCSDYNSLEVRRASRSKRQARDMFAKNNIPYAKWTIFFSPYKAYKFVKENWFPVCIKPNVWWYSRWSHFPINTWEEFWKACFMVKAWWPTSVIESYLSWKNYRVVVTKIWWIEIAMERYPGFVIWDWKKTISSLIDDENEIRKNMKLPPVIHLIEKNKKIGNFLKKQGLTFDSVLEKDRKVSVFHRLSLAPGGILETVDISTITKKNKEIFLKILNLFDSNIFGIDVIMEKWIDIDFDKQKCIFLEVNSRPYLEMHNFPRYWKAPNMDNIYKNLDKLEVMDRGIY